MAMNNLQPKGNSASQTKKNQLPASGRVRELCGSGTTTCDGLIKAMRGNIGSEQQHSHRIQTGPVMDGNEHMALSTLIQTNSTPILSIRLIRQTFDDRLTRLWATASENLNIVTEQRRHFQRTRRPRRQFHWRTKDKSVASDPIVVSLHLLRWTVLELTAFVPTKQVASWRIFDWTEQRCWGQKCRCRALFQVSILHRSIALRVLDNSPFDSVTIAPTGSTQIHEKTGRIVPFWHWMLRLIESQSKDV